MTDTTDIAALRNKFGNKLPTPEQARERLTELLNSPHGTSWFLAPHAIALLDALEAERQRADEAVKERRESIAARRKSSTQWREQFDAVHLRARKAEAELAELKGEQVPFGYVEHQAAVKVVKGETRFAALTMEPKGDKCLPLFTAPQKPVVLPGKITRGFVELAEMYGCEPAQAQFIAVGWNAAIEAAGGIVKESK